MFLADQGADVIKIEPLGGDITRRSRQSISASGEFSALFVSTNRGKRSLALDLKRPEAAEIIRKLVTSSDVLVQNFRPGTMERLGLGERTGERQHIRLAMLDTMIAYLWPEAMTQYTVVGREATTADPTARPDLIFETADGYITVGTISDSEWLGFCAASGRSGLAEDP